MEYLLLILAALILLYFISHPFHLQIRRLMGYRIIECRGITSAIKGKVWRTYIHSVEASPIILGHAYRYPATKTGEVIIYNDGSGRYCGTITWRFI